MYRYFIPIILIGIAVAAFFLFTSPLYNNPETGIKALQAQVVSYNEALNNSKSLEAERDKLTKVYNSISKEDLEKLTKFLPDSVDNIRLILEIEKIASPYGMALTDVRYNTADKDASESGGEVPNLAASKEYGSWDLEFSTSGSYSDFINLLKSLESNLRMVDISSIQFSSETGSLLNANSYKYSFSIKTYWLKS